jgi:integrase
LVCAIYNYACLEATFALPRNPATAADRRPEPERARLDFYSPEEVEALARAVSSGQHRDPRMPAVGDDEADARAAEDRQDAEATSTKSRCAREVPLPDQAAGALDRLSQRRDFATPDDFVFVNRLGRRLDGSALRRRVERARERGGLPPPRFHDLRHTYGSLLVAGGVVLVSVKAAMGHSRITTTERYLHARSAGQMADRFTRALAPAEPTSAVARETAL